VGISLTKKELASVAGYSYRRLHDIDTGLPQDGKLFVEGEDKKYDLAVFVQRWVSYNVSNATVGDQTLDEVKAIHERVKTKKTELEVAKMEGRLVDVQDVRRLWGDIANTVMQNMIHLPSKVAPMVVMMKSAEQIAAIIDREVRDILNSIADAPVPEYAQASISDEEGEDDGEV